MCIFNLRLVALSALFHVRNRSNVTCSFVGSHLVVVYADPASREFDPFHFVKEVSGTRLLVAATGDGRQLTCYQNYVKLVSSNPDLVSPKKVKQPAGVRQAMILPFVLQDDGSGAEPIVLVDLTAHGSLVETMEQAFPKVVSNVKCRSRAAKNLSRNSLAVFEVGSYVCSVAYGIEDLHRIDPDTFKVADNVAELLSAHYSAGYGFLICKLRESGKQHPIAYVTSIRDDTLFVPTRHEHGDGGDSLPKWDHWIYSLCATADEAGESPEEMEVRLNEELSSGHVVKSGNIQAVVGALANLPVELKVGASVDAPEIRRLRIAGRHTNKDMFFPLAGVALGSGGCEMLGTPDDSLLVVPPSEASS